MQHIEIKMETGNDKQDLTEYKNRLRGKKHSNYFYQWNHTLIQPAWEEVCGRFDMEVQAHRKQAGTDRKLVGSRLT